MASGSSQAKRWIRAAAAGLHHSHSHATYITAHANARFLTHWVGPGSRAASSWILSHNGNSHLTFLFGFNSEFPVWWSPWIILGMNRIGRMRVTMSLYKAYLWPWWPREGNNEEISKKPKKKVKMSRRKKQSCATWNLFWGEHSLKVILLCTKHSNSLDKYGVAHVWILIYHTSVSSYSKAFPESSSMATARSAPASLIS